MIFYFPHLYSVSLIGGWIAFFVISVMGVIRELWRLNANITKRMDEIPGYGDYNGWDLPAQIYSAMMPYPLSLKLLSSFYALVILAAFAIVPQFLQYSTDSSMYNHLLVLLPGQASSFANILQQYMSYEIENSNSIYIGIPVSV